MRHTRWPLALAALTLTAAPLPAQPFGVYGGSLHYSRVRLNSSLSLSLGSFNRFGYPLGCFPMVPTSYTRVSIAYYQPQPIVLVQPIVVPQPILVPEQRLIDDLFPPPPPQPRMPEPPQMPPMPAVPPLPGGQPAGVFRPLEPNNRDRAREAVKPAPPSPEPRIDMPVRPPPLPVNDPRDEAARLIALGREAFEAGEYGRAAERFRQARAVSPADGPAYFLLAQALVALARYDEAADVIRAGLAHRPDWPAGTFRMLDLYGDNVADYADHLDRIHQTLARFPDEPDLRFLTAYLMWFDGRKDEARDLFRRARPMAADPTFIDRFLRALPPADTL